MTTPIGPWPLGVDNRTGDRARLPRDEEGREIALRDGANVDIDRDGRPSRRAGRSRVLAMHGIRDLWTSEAGRTFAAVGTTLYVVHASGMLEPIGELNSADPCSYAELNGEVIVSNRSTLLRVVGAAARPLGAPDAPPPECQPADAGGLPAGRYAVGVTFLSGDEEGGMSPLRFVQVEDGGGIALSGLLVPDDATSIRVYRSHPNGTDLYRVTDLPVGVASYHLGASPLGAASETRGLRRTPPGELVAAWRGRLLVAHGRYLRFTVALRYGLHSPRHGFVQFPHRVQMLGPVDGGVFVGTTGGVVFLRGSTPKEWEQETAGAMAPLRGNAVTITSGQTRSEAPGQRMALWLAPNGYVMGTPEGMVVELQSSRVRLAHEKAAICIHDRRATAAVT